MNDHPKRRRDDPGLERYRDMLDLERPVSKKHKPMPIPNRAAQFMPFAALTGYDSVIDETADQNTEAILLSEAGIPDLETLESDYKGGESNVLYDSTRRQTGQ